MPYKKPYINLLESFVLADLAVLLMVALTDQFRVGCLHIHTYVRSYVLIARCILLITLTLLSDSCYLTRT